MVATPLTRPADVPEAVLPSGRTAPAHVAVIMDGNGRWAQARGLPRLAGHRAGIEAVRRTVRAAISHGVPYLTLFAFSSENWHRAPQEVSDLTGLLRYYLRHKVAELHDEGVRIRFIGDFSRFDEELRGDLVGAEILTRGNSRLTLTLALSYGGRSDIMQAASRLAQAIADRDVDPARLTERDFSRFLLTADTPDPDLIVRTSGEYRLSNFLLWQSAYAELVFRDVLWPDFDEAEFAAVMALFARRERRFGVRPA